LAEDIIKEEDVSAPVEAKSEDVVEKSEDVVEKSEDVVEKSEAVVEKGPSKKELNKLEKKMKKEAHKGGDESAKTVSTDPSLGAQTIPEAAAADASGSLEIVYCNEHAIQLTCVVASVLGVELRLVKSKENAVHLPYATSEKHGSISGDTNIARYVCRSSTKSGMPFCIPKDGWLASQCDQWLDAYASYSGIV
jgi:hypothetical protein